MNIEDGVAFASIEEVRRRMDAGEFGPVALTEALLARVAASQNSLNSFITITPETAIQQAAAAQAAQRNSGPQGPLHGIPVAYKDLLATAGPSSAVS